MDYSLTPNARLSLASELAVSAEVWSDPFAALNRGSFWGQFAEIDRPSTCEVEYLDYNGKKKNLKCDNLLATCIQHEIDHIEGITILT